MRFAPTRLAALAAAVALLAPAAARAQFTVYTSLAGFLAATSGAGADTFDDLAPGALGAPLARSAGPWAYTASVNTTDFFVTGLGADRWLSTNTATDVITFAGFAPGVRGVGGFLFATDEQGAFARGVGLTMRATAAGTTSTFTLPTPSPTAFWGVVAGSAITSLSVEVTSQPAALAWPTVSGLAVAGAATVVPEPGTVALTAAGLALLAGAGRVLGRPLGGRAAAGGQSTGSARK